MRLIIKLNEKKYEVLWQGGDFEKFKDQLRKDLNLEGEIKISFTDNDEETIVLADQYDFEYMISNVSDERNFLINVEGK